MAKKTSKFHIAGPLWGESWGVDSFTKRASNGETFLCHGGIMQGGWAISPRCPTFRTSEIVWFFMLITDWHGLSGALSMSQSVACHYPDHPKEHPASSGCHIHMHDGQLHVYESGKWASKNFVRHVKPWIYSLNHEFIFASTVGKRGPCLMGWGRVPFCQLLLPWAQHVAVCMLWPCYASDDDILMKGPVAGVLLTWQVQHHSLMRPPHPGYPSHESEQAHQRYRLLHSLPWHLLDCYWDVTRGLWLLGVITYVNWIECRLEDTYDSNASWASCNAL